MESGRTTSPAGVLSVRARQLVTPALGLGLAMLATLYGSLLAVEKAGADGGAKWVGAAVLSVLGTGFVFSSRPALSGIPTPLIHGFSRELKSEPSSGSALTAGYVTVVALALLSTGAALIHFVVIETHVEQWWLFGAAFAAMALVQQGWAILLLTHLSRLLLAVGALFNFGIIVVWIVSRTSGLPFGPEAGEAEPIGFSDVVATAFELAIVVGGFLLVRSTTVPNPVRRAAMPLLALCVLAAVVVTVFALYSAVGTSSFLPHTE